MAEAAERTCYRHPDRVTGLSCSECGRPICTECMTPAPVGIRCPEHSGRPQGAARVVRGVQRVGYQGTGIITRLLVARQRDYVFGGSALAIIILNLAFTFSVHNISIGGHIGGLVGGAAATLGLSRFGRGHAAYGRLGLVGAASILAVGIASIALAYWKVHHLT